jgi:hypothetical protein
MELTSSIYFTKDATCHGHLPQQIDSKSVMRATFKIGLDKDTFGGVLLCHLQRKEYSGSDDRSNTDKDTLISTQLLVIWEFRIDRLYSHAWIIEHENTVTWNEDKLERLYDAYDSLYDTDIIFNTGRWLLDDNTELQTVCETSYEEDFEVNIIISEEKNLLRPRKPLWIDPNRQVPTELIISFIDLMSLVLFFTIRSKYIFVINVQISSWYLQHTLVIT